MADRADEGSEICKRAQRPPEHQLCELRDCGTYYCPRFRGENSSGIRTKRRRRRVAKGPAKKHRGARLSEEESRLVRASAVSAMRLSRNLAAIRLGTFLFLSTSRLLIAFGLETLMVPRR